MDRKVLTLIRGAPGSGKSTLAAIIAEQSHAVHFETDMYWMDEEGNYNFDATQLGKAHEWCQTQVFDEMERGQWPVVVSNTFSRRWEMAEYIEMARLYGYEVQYINCYADFGDVHDCPPDVIAKIKERFDHDPHISYALPNGFVGQG